MDSISTDPNNFTQSPYDNENDSELQAKIRSFLWIARDETKASARRILIAAGGDVQKAISLYFNEKRAGDDFVQEEMPSAAMRFLSEDLNGLELTPVEYGGDDDSRTQAKICGFLNSIRDYQTPDVAKMFLELAGGDLDEALRLYQDNNPIYDAPFDIGFDAGEFDPSLVEEEDDGPFDIGFDAGEFDPSLVEEEDDGPFVIGFDAAEFDDPPATASPPYHHWTFDMAKTAAELGNKWLVVQLGDTSQFNSGFGENDKFLVFQEEADTEEGIRVKNLFLIEHVPATLLIEPYTSLKLVSVFGGSPSLEDFQPYCDDSPKLYCRNNGYEI